MDQQSFRTSNGSTGRSAVLIAALFAVWGAAPAAAQQPRPLTPTGTQNLQFGTVLPGVPVTVLRTDPAFSGQFQVRGTARAPVRVDLTLPAALTGPSGSSLPLLFGAADGGWSTSPSINSATGFDPRTPLTTTLSTAGRLYLFLGGQVVPPGQLLPGPYSATITITVTYL